MLLTLSLEFSTAATFGGILTMRWGFVSLNGSQTLAGRFKFKVVNSPTSLTVFASFVAMADNLFPIEIRAFMNSNSGASRRA